MAARHDDGEGLARALGWFSIGLGVAQLAAPRRMNRMVGVAPDRKSTATMRAIGVREIAAGVGLLTRPRPAEWAWARVAGDAMDLALVGDAMTSDDSDRPRAATTLAALLGITALDVYCARRLTTTRREPMTTAADAKQHHGMRVRKSVTVNRPADEVYAFWRNLENLPRFMKHLESVQVTGGGRSHWKANAPAGTSVEWDAETTEDRPNERIAWRSVDGADVPNAGVVRFVPAAGGRGTEIHVDLRYDPPAGKLGALVAKLFGDEPGQQVDGDLRRFKQVLEVGEVLYSEASIASGLHPAHPPEGPAPQLYDREDTILAERSADAAATTSSNLDRASSTPPGEPRPSSAMPRA
ncbi:SRPBCC family protein [Roseisolibacter sp. H3M3-2]|uniref:SRPBCC family protein n=1 Tax=Roseisolibacter sp. H3M3-2 TaxID=3031323 RepID=UPI0023DB45AD|nr:SRPBCC family protein [Roseisolibacter sp. H3M3-2]MDF1502420.1 SRPBCC family protein [Roseisolibacter sp. H3M3-2]